MNKSIILLPHFNSPEGLYKTVRSIASTESVDLLVVDDGSTNKFNPERLISSYFAKGDVKTLFLPENRGIQGALNEGLRFIIKKGYKYVARLDTNDLVLGNRFGIQESYLENNPDIALIGSYAHFVDEEGDPLFDVCHPVSYERIKNKMYVNSTFVHPAITFRTSMIQEVGLYPEDYHAAEDYALFFKVIKKYKCENLPEFLMQCEVSKHGISGIKRRQQLNNRLKLIRENFSFGYWPIYGLLRNSILYMIPRGVLTFIKKQINKGSI